MFFDAARLGFVVQADANEHWLMRRRNISADCIQLFRFFSFRVRPRAPARAGVEGRSPGRAAGPAAKSGAHAAATRPIFPVGGQSKILSSFLPKNALLDFYLCIAAQGTLWMLGNVRDEVKPQQQKAVPEEIYLSPL